jgi:hypothetical protein
MEQVELWRVQRSLLWHAGIVAAIVVLIMALPQVGTVHVAGPSGTSYFAPGTGVALSVIASFAAFFAAIYASSVGTSLNRENVTRDLSWTKPLARSVLAARYVLIDLVGVVIAFAIALVAIGIIATYMHFPPYVDAQAPVELALGAGIGAMWYGLLQVLTCAAPPGARSLAGVLWPVALVCGALSAVPGSIGAIMRAIDVLNPLSYMGGGVVQHGTREIGMPADERALIVWGFALAFCALAIFLWPRKEA